MKIIITIKTAILEWKKIIFFKVLSPTDAQENFFKRNIKIYIKTAATCFGVITIIRERTICAY
jgi:hypothetical protein